MGVYKIEQYTYKDPMIREYRTGFADQLARPETLNAVAPSYNSANKITTSTTSSVIAKYDNGEGRLTAFVNADPNADVNRVAYLTLVNPTNTEFDDVDDKIAPVDRSVLADLFKATSGRYDKFILDSVQANREEKAQIVPTFGDNYAALFTGKRPLVISVSGRLVCDYDSKLLSWYKAFVFAYEYFLRASRLAKFKVKLRLVIPGINEYEGYILSMTDTQTSSEDMLIPFSFTMLAAEVSPFKPYVPSKAAAKGAGITQKVDKKFPSVADPNSKVSAWDKMTQGTTPFNFDRQFSPDITSTFTEASKVFENATRDLQARMALLPKEFPVGQLGMNFNPAEIGKIVSQQRFAASADAWFNSNTVIPVINEAAEKFATNSDFIFNSVRKKMMDSSIQENISKLNTVVSKFAKNPGLIDIALRDIFGKRKIKLYESL